MAESSGDKQSKGGRSRKGSTTRASKSAKGKDAVVSDEKFRGDGINFKCKLLGSYEVPGSRGDSMCIEAIKKLKSNIKQTGEHKQKIVLNVTLKGIRIFDEKTRKLLYEHPVNKVSFITHDPDDKKIFGYISSALCKTGHVMYAIKYDKVAGVITATLYELFQAVFKLRQEAALQMKAQINAQAKVSAVSNGPSTAAPGTADPVDESNIYEEPKSTVTATTVEDTSPDDHYQVPVPRPLPPAPYATPFPANPQDTEGDKTTERLQSVDSTAVNSSISSDTSFGASVITQMDHPTYDNVSLSSVDRKESISSSSSETASFDTRSLDLKSGSTTSTPSVSSRGRQVPFSSHAVPSPSVPSPSVPSPVVPSLAVASPVASQEDEEHDYETIPSSDYETIPSIVKPKVSAGFASFNFQESFTEVAQPRSDSLPVSADSEVDPFASSGPFNNSTAGPENPRSSGLFGNDDFFASFSTFDEMATTTLNKDLPVDDPFAPTSSSATQESQPSETFASSDLFETAFAPGQMLPFEPNKELKDSNVEEKEDDLTKVAPEQDLQKHQDCASSDHFEVAFDSKDVFPPLKSQVNVQKETEKDSNAEKPSSTEPKGEPSWMNAFGERGETEIGKAEPTWSNAFGEDEKPTREKEDKKSEKDEEAKAEFSWDKNFGEKVDGKDEKQQSDPSNSEISWSTAFDKKPQSDLSFSWGDAFGGQSDTTVGGAKNDSDVMSFEDAFASTPFKDHKPISGIKTDSNNFAVKILSPVKQDSKEQENMFKEKETTTNISETQKELDDSMFNLHSKQTNDNEEREGKVTLADNEDLSSSSDNDSETSAGNTKHDDNKTIPVIIEPTEHVQRSETSGKPIRPTSIPIAPSENDSPNAPPPLPPRAKAALPSLPPRPRTYSSPVASHIPATRPRHVGATGSPSLAQGSPASRSKRPPPALPPRIDLETEKPRSNSSVAAPSTTSTFVGFTSDPFTTTASGDNSSGQADWAAHAEKKNKSDKLDNISKPSPDPFSDDFFTDFNFGAVKDADDTKPNGPTPNNVFHSDPFVPKQGTGDIFKVDFGGKDPFAEFSSNDKKNLGPDLFSGFSKTDDPFSDISDPFAEKVVLSDPFAARPKKEGTQETSFHLSKDSLDGDFDDSFA